VTPCPAGQPTTPCLAPTPTTPCLAPYDDAVPGRHTGVTVPVRRLGDEAGDREGYDPRAHRAPVPRDAGRSMSRVRKVLLGVAVVLVVLVAGVAWYLAPIAPIATGYAAKIVCSGHFVADRPVEDVERDLPENPLVPLLRISADRDEQTVTATLAGLWGTTAFHTEGLGCTLTDERPALAGPEPAVHDDPEAPWPAGDGPPELPAGVDPDELERAVDVAFLEDDADGRRRNTRAVVVIKDGQLIAERYGDGFDADTPLLGWSMTKSVANAMVGRLVATGTLALDDDQLLANWAADDRAGITVEHLLQMTAGLEFEEVYDPGTDATNMLFTPRDAGAYAAGKPLRHPPGTSWAYSSGSTNILCDVAHRASGLGPEMANELVFAPLGMTSAVMEPDVSRDLVCSSHLYATARDWARLGQWFLQDGEWDGERLLPDGWVDYSTTPVEVATESPYGAQWWLNEGPDGDLRMAGVPADAYWASGNEGQQVVVIPSEELVVVRLGFSGEFSGIEWGLEPLLTGVIAATS
jgi:CubicO group peptidase (beta-lactamase class C family)